MRTKKKSKDCLPFILIGFMFLCGAGIFLYPDISEWYNRRHQIEVITKHQDAMEKMSEEELNREKELINKYNEGLLTNRVMLTDPFDESALKYNGAEYNEILAKDDIMAYVEIPQIDVYLPIYHGTSKETLEKGSGHLEHTSLPLGGAGTHMVISGHTGLPSAKLFTDLEKLRIGDTFYIYVLDETLEYKVDNISIVEPTDISKLSILPDKDYVTMVTCTPYGKNTHRLLVRGTRVNTKNVVKIEQIADKDSGILKKFSDWLESRHIPMWAAQLSGVIVAIALIILLLTGIWEIVKK